MAQPPSDGRAEVMITGDYLHLPVRKNGARQKMSLQLGKELREFDISVAMEDPDFWVFTDVRAYRGQTVSYWLADGSTPPRLKTADEIPGADSLYRETLRPQVHFSSRRGWLNDPNGLVYQNGEYHLFYQHNPYGIRHGNMHWGHAVSTDLLHWEELPIAIRPRKHGDWAFSGSAVVDKDNTAGFGKDALVAVYTSTGRGECLAYSTDGGRTMTEYAGNPVLKHTGRDPKVFWYEPEGHWVMVVFDEREVTEKNGEMNRPKHLRIYTSPNLKEWTYASSNGPFWECPELFELPVEGENGVTKWIMHGANTQYQVGTFDGYVFTPKTPRIEFRSGALYAAQLWNNAPDGRKIMIGWGAGITAPGMPFTQLMTIPVELRLERGPGGLRLLPRPVRELAGLRKKTETHPFFTVHHDSTKTVMLPPAEEAIHLKMSVDLSDAFGFTLNLRGYKLEYKVLDHKLNNVLVPPKEDNTVDLEIIMDRTSVEVFANDGAGYIVNSHVGRGDLIISSDVPDWHPGRGVRIRKLEVSTLSSVWE